MSSPNAEDLEARILWHSNNSTRVYCQEEHRGNSKGPYLGLACGVGNVMLSNIISSDTGHRQQKRISVEWVLVPNSSKSLGCLSRHKWKSTFLSIWRRFISAAYSLQVVQKQGFGQVNVAQSSMQKVLLLPHWHTKLLALLAASPGGSAIHPLFPSHNNFLLFIQASRCNKLLWFCANIFLLACIMNSICF